MDSTNINTNVAQIILPPDMELRKIKNQNQKLLRKKESIRKTKTNIKRI